MYGKQMDLAICAIVLAVFARGAIAQNYAIDWHTIDGGAGTSTSGSYALLGTAGQPDAASASGANYELSGGFYFSSSGEGIIDPPGVGDDACSGGTNDGSACSTDSDCPGGVCGLKSRYITVSTSSAAASTGGTATTIQVKLTSMSQFPEREGEVWWAGASHAIPNPPHPSALGAGLVCETAPSHAEVWPGGYLHLYGPSIIPVSIYEVRVCDESGMNCSAPLTVATGKWGDVVAGFGGSGQPNFADITALVDKFKELANAPDVSRTDLVPEVPNQVTNFADISADVDAFKGSPYPNAIPACP